MCEHKRLKTVNNRLFCMDCGAELPLEFLTAPKAKPEKPKKQTTKKRDPKDEKVIGFR